MCAAEHDPDIPALGSWVGLGGDTTNALVQAGTSVLASGYPGYPTYGAWYEYLTSSGGGILPVFFTNPVVSGDNMYAEVDVDTTTSPPTTSFLVADNTQSWGQLVNVQVANVYDGTSAEWIDERQWNKPLMNYGWTMWTHMADHHTNASWSTWTPAYSEPTEWWIMMTSDGNPYPSNGNRELSQTTGTYSDSHMQNHWHNCS